MALPPYPSLLSTLKQAKPETLEWDPGINHVSERAIMTGSYRAMIESSSCFLECTLTIPLEEVEWGHF